LPLSNTTVGTNNRVLQAASVLRAERFTHQQGGSFSSILGTLVHIVGWRVGWLTYWKEGKRWTGEEMFTDDPLDMFGTQAVVRIPHLRSLMQHLCRKGFEYHVAINSSHCSSSIAEALQSYLGGDVYLHQAA
jgi:L-fucose isomerase, C-terminal domain/DinB family